MPTYQYECPRCGVFEKFQGIKDDPLEKCETCGSAVVRMTSGGGGIIFKGSGFYQTDYKAKRSKAEGSSSKSSED